WKIARRNLESFGRDRQAQARRREQLDVIRNKALADIGPQAAAQPVAQKAPMQLASAPQAASQPAPTPTPQPQPAQPQQPDRRQSWDFHLPGSGSGPVGPLGVIAALWLARRKRKPAYLTFCTAPPIRRGRLPFEPPLCQTPNN